MPRPRRNYTRDLGARGRRPGARAATGNSFLIVVEGEATERAYLEALRDELQLNAARVAVVHAGVTDPVNIVRAAVELRDRQAARVAKTLTVPFDEVWAVFDREKQDHPRREQMPAALQLAAGENVAVAYSNPSFEFWLLLHYRYTTAAFTDGAAVIAALKEFIPGYAKAALPMPDLLPRLSVAMRHARQCRLHWEQVGGDWNPHTEVNGLVEAMNGSVNHTFRLF